MSFKKNLATVIVAILLVLLGSWIVEIPANALIDGMTLVVATMVITLLLEDMWRKGFTDRSLLTWEFYMGAMIIAGSVLMWLWASVAQTMTDAIIRLVATFLSAVLGGWWMASPYKRSVQTDDDRAQELADRYDSAERKRWRRWKKKISHSTREDSRVLLADRLRYCLTNDSLSGNLDFARPLCMIDGKALSYNEAVKAGVQQHALGVVDAYIDALTIGQEE